MLNQYGYDDLFNAIDIILESNCENEKTIVFFKKLFELSKNLENKYFVLEKAIYWKKNI